MTARRFKFDIRQAGRVISVVLGVWAVLNAGFFILGTRPRVREYNDLQRGTGPQQEELRTRRAAVEAREAFLQALREAETDLRELRSVVLATREERMIDAQLELTELAERFSTDLDSVTFENDMLHEEELDKLVMTAPLEGGYANLRKFLQAVEASDKFFVVERVALGEGKQGGVMLELSITLATYFDAPEEVKRANKEKRRPRRRAGAGRS